ncbi:MAG: membrane integrity-associated transporter subunit PqiC [Alphaproteobacteria bacterium]|nr:membrane integrity-associated transporter subunit PqiC [Alphaproteobacteria bacterium]
MTFPTAARLSRRLVPSAFIFVLASCSGLFGGESTHLYRLTPKSTYPPNLPHRSVQLLVDVPLAPAGLDNSRIALSRSPVSMDYFADSEWTDRVPLLVQTALLQSFENSKTVTAIDRESVGLRADFVLRTEIRHFEAVYDSSNGPPEVWVSIIVRLVNPSSRDVVAQTSFERRRRASANDVPSIVSAFDEAIGGVMQDIVVWTVTNPALSVKPA